jgi:hypothetical protein
VPPELKEFKSPEKLSLNPESMLERLLPGASSPFIRLPSLKLNFEMFVAMLPPVPFFLCMYLIIGMREHENLGSRYFYLSILLSALNILLTYCTHFLSKSLLSIITF